MLLVSKRFLRYLSLNSLFFGLEKTDPRRPLVFQVTHRRPSERKGPHLSQPVVRCNIQGVSFDWGVMLTKAPIKGNRAWEAKFLFHAPVSLDWGTPVVHFS